MRILSKLNAMSLGKKIYAGLWAVTGGLLIALIVMFVGMNKTYGETNPPKDGWTIKTTGSADNIKYQADQAYNVLATPKVAATGLTLTFDSIKDAKLKADFNNEYNKNVFLVGSLPADATTDSHFAIYAKAVRGTDKDKFVELTQAINSADLNKLLNKKGTDAAASTTEFALTDIKIVDEVALKNVYVSADGKQTVEKTDTGARLATVNDEAIKSMDALYDIDKWDTKPTDKAKTAINSTATVGGLFGLALVGTVFTTVGVSVYEKRRGGKN